MIEKRFTFDSILPNVIKIKDGEKCLTGEDIVDCLNIFYEENKQLKQELAIYRKLASCSNCEYHNYDWYDDGDEFEVCDKGNDVTEGICKDWVEL